MKLFILINMAKEDHPSGSPINYEGGARTASARKPPNLRLHVPLPPLPSAYALHIRPVRLRLATQPARLASRHHTFSPYHSQPRMQHSHRPAPSTPALVSLPSASLSVHQLPRREAGSGGGRRRDAGTRYCRDIARKGSEMISSSHPELVHRPGGPSSSTGKGEGGCEQGRGDSGRSACRARASRGALHC